MLDNPKYTDTVTWIQESLTVVQLKTLLRHVKLSTAGRKADLQQRLLDFLALQLRANRTAVIEALYAKTVEEMRNASSGRSTASLAASSEAFRMATGNVMPTYTQQVNNLSGRDHSGGGTSSLFSPYRHIEQASYVRSLHGGINPMAIREDVIPKFKHSPFYELIRPIHDPLMFSMPFPNDKLLRVNSFVLSEQEKAAVLSGAHGVYVFSTVHNGLSTHFADVIFPPQLDLTVNNKPISWNFRGLKGKPGTARPTDVTPVVAQAARNGVTKHTISVTVFRQTDDPNEYIFVAYLVRIVPIPALLDEVKLRPVISKQAVVQQLVEQNEDDEIVAMSTIHSLRDPVSFVKIKIAVRALSCKHIDCIDLETFLQLQMQAPTWICPICNSPLSYKSLSPDGYFQDIIDRTGPEVSEVEIEPNGTWKVVALSDDEETDSDDDGGLARRQSNIRVKREEGSSVPAVARRKETPIVIDLDVSDSEEQIMAGIVEHPQEEQQPQQQLVTPGPNGTQRELPSSHAYPEPMMPTPPPMMTLPTRMSTYSMLMETDEDSQPPQLPPSFFSNYGFFARPENIRSSLLEDPEPRNSGPSFSSPQAPPYDSRPYVSWTLGSSLLPSDPEVERVGTAATEHPSPPQSVASPYPIQISHGASASASPAISGRNSFQALGERYSTPGNIASMTPLQSPQPSTTNGHGTSVMNTDVIDLTLSDED